MPITEEVLGRLSWGRYKY